MPRLASLGGAILIAMTIPGCATAPGDDEGTAAMLRSSFQPAGQVGLDRLNQDDTQRACSAAASAPPPRDVAAKIEATNLATVRYPADGKLLGDWRNGEKIAQEGRGWQFSDDPGGPIGGNCYACHQLAPSELAFGTIGPSLYRYLERRGDSAQTQQYTYAKIYDSEAFAACSNMPRFGTKGILSEQQIKDVTALLLDPRSPVNQ